ncbi:hypothetical protein [Acetobacter sp. DsW_063]|uniref:hypothetical protein n=1 Tax=Acetobacter sp. DsW_063 TaxID=1514894 RepID=UPI000A3B55C0|nr:hypothetical protein [Acetobacter sp. DsW_063]OUJ15609.1 hypothetical protein HK28_07480 [Acetobacter sp. DsW_063]
MGIGRFQPGAAGGAKGGRPRSSDYVRGVAGLALRVGLACAERPTQRKAALVPSSQREGGL